MHFEHVQKAQEREQQRESLRAQYKPPVVKTVQDIKTAIRKVAPEPSAQTVNVTAKIGDISVGAPSIDVSLRSTIIGSFDIIKKRQNIKATVSEADINGRISQLPAPVTADAHMEIDEILKNALGASREGTSIFWTLPDGKYVYDIYEHKLSRVTA